MIAYISRFLIKTLPLWVIVLVVTELLLSNELVGLGKQVKHIDGQIDAVVADNDSLREHIASVSSLLVIEQKASELGLEKAKKYLTLSSDQFPVAYHPVQ